MEKLIICALALHFSLSILFVWIIWEDDRLSAAQKIIRICFILGAPFVGVLVYIKSKRRNKCLNA